MPRADRSIAVLTGMIIAALYVILLVSFSQESYMRRDAMHRADVSGGWQVIQDVSKRACRVEPPLCRASEPVVPLTLQGLRRAMRDDP
jgi:hypothetical protein